LLSLKGIPRWDFVEVQVVEAQLTDSDIGRGNKSDKFHNTIRTVLENKYSEVTIKKCYEEQNVFVSLQISNSVNISRSNELFSFCKKCNYN
jgi:hypothetical protein